MAARLFRTPSRRRTVWAIYVALMAIGVAVHSAELAVRQSRNEFRPEADTIAIGMFQHAIGSMILGLAFSVVVWVSLLDHRKSVSLFALDRSRPISGIIALVVFGAVAVTILKGTFAADSGIWFVVPYEMSQVWFLMILRASASAERESR